MYRPLLPVLLFAAVVALLPAQTGDEAAAERYAEWAAGAMAEGRWTEALEALERAQDFAAVSSDLSYMLAQARYYEGQSLDRVLEAVRRALATERWNRYRPEEARLLEAELLIRIRSFSEALAILNTLSGANAALLRLSALMGQEDAGGVFEGASPGLIRDCRTALERYPRDGRFVELIFRFEARRLPGSAGERALIEFCLGRFRFLLDEYPGLAWLAVPFMADTAEASRLVASYRAKGGGAPEAIPAALRLGIIDGARAAAELFGEPTVDWNLILAVWNLLATEAEQDAFGRNLLGFSGVISEDADYDGYPESFAKYVDGLLAEYRYDIGQDLLYDWEIYFEAGLPARGRFGVASGQNWALPWAEPWIVAELGWEQYPAVLAARLGELSFQYRPGEFSFRPIRFQAYFGLGLEGFVYPARDTGLRLTSRMLASYAALIERPGGNFTGSRERVETAGGVPFRSVEYLDGRAVAETEFSLGAPRLQRLDLNLDGRMETIRRFRPLQDLPGDLLLLDYGPLLESSESDWDGDGRYETGEEYLPDGRIIRSWDIDLDGIREYSVLIEPVQAMMKDVP